MIRKESKMALTFVIVCLCFGLSNTVSEFDGKYVFASEFNWHFLYTYYYLVIFVETGKVHYN